jgi:hypothetical protein
MAKKGAVCAFPFALLEMDKSEDKKAQKHVFERMKLPSLN